MTQTLIPVPGDPPQVIIKKPNWPLALVFCVFILAVVGSSTFLMMHVLDTPERVVASTGQAARDVLAAIAPAFRPNVQVKTLVISTLDDVKVTPKLVVLTAKVNATVEKSSSTTWGFIDFGTTTVRVVARDNLIQYTIPLDDLSSNSFQYDSTTQTLTLLVPRPRIDTQFVSVQSDPELIDVETSNGWAKLDHYSGAPLRTEARAELRDATILEGIKPWVRDEADRGGKKALTDLLKPLAAQLRDGVKLDIRYRELGQ
jgi:hypothetical protein